MLRPCSISLCSKGGQAGCRGQLIVNYMCWCQLRQESPVTVGPGGEGDDPASGCWSPWGRGSFRESTDPWPYGDWETHFQHILSGRLFFFFLIRVALKCCISFYSSAKWISHMYTHIPSFFGFPSHLSHHRALSRVPCAVYSRLPWVIFFICGSVYVSILISHYIPPLLSPLVSIRLFSTSASLFLLCKGDRIRVSFMFPQLSLEEWA